MCRVLIVGPIWQYHGGGARLHGLAKYLLEYGWQPVVLTQRLPAEATLPYRVEPVVAWEAVARVARGFAYAGRSPASWAYRLRTVLSSGPWSAYASCWTILTRMESGGERRPSGDASCAARRASTQSSAHRHRCRVTSSPAS